MESLIRRIQGLCMLFMYVDANIQLLDYIDATDCAYQGHTSLYAIILCNLSPRFNMSWDVKLDTWPPFNYLAKTSEKVNSIQFANGEQYPCRNNSDFSMSLCIIPS